ncbi:MAG: hypothetical protein EOP04_06955 [Proteobacteria bacterium]|nr:MAG: hypothetical protein EOP04_06955 [Pseudomonadota bacterium]
MRTCKTAIRTGKIYERYDGRPRKIPVEMLKGIRVRAGLQMILMNLAHGKPLNQIAKENFTSVRTLESAIYDAKKKLKVTTREELIRIALIEKFIQ